MTLYRGPGGTGSATSDADTTLYQDFLNQTIAARDAALQAEINAELAETNAETAETNAETAETNAETAATNAASSASAAASSASSASTSASNASTSASAASTSATNAASSASSASTSATAASTSASNAATSATNASNSASSASTSATNAANSASTATTQATNAASSATAAASSASSASTSAANAANSASSASTSATNAANSATAAAASATAAAASAASINPADLVHISGTETITGAKTFSQTITGSITGNAGTVTNGVYTTGDQTIAGTKTLSSNPILSAGTVNGLAFLNASKVLTTGSALTFDGTNLGVGGIQNYGAGTASATIDGSTYAALVLRNGGVRYGQIYATSSALTLDTWSGTGPIVFSINTAEQMRLTSTGLGIGTSSPSSRLTVNSGASTTTAQFTSTGSSVFLGMTNSGSTAFIGADSTGSFIVQTPGSGYATKLTVDSVGNLGLGVTPSAWSGFKAFEVGRVGLGLWQTSNSFGVTSNAYNASGWKYAVSGIGAVLYEAVANTHAWYNAPSGTAGNAISFTQAMTLDASGRLGIGTTSPSCRIHAVGAGEDQAEIQAQNTSTAANSRALLRIKSATSNFGSGLMQTNGTDGSYPTSSLCLYSFDAQPLVFGTSNTERARIDSSGRLLVGLTSSAGPAGGAICQIAQGNANWIHFVNNTNTSGNIYGSSIYFSYAPNNTSSGFFACGDTSAERLRIYANGGIANFQANNVNLSDRREKTNFAPAKSYLETICAIPVQTFNYADQNMEEDPGLTLGVVAQDVQAVAPELVMESNWGTQDEPKMRLSIYQTDLQYALMKCIQEQQAIITQLKARLDAANL